MLLAANAAQTGGLAASVQPLVTMLFILVIFWALVIRPQQQKDKAHKVMLGKLKKGDKVIMTSGIHGEITDVKEDVLTVRIADRVEVKANKSAISILKG